MCRVAYLVVVGHHVLGLCRELTLFGRHVRRVGAGVREPLPAVIAPKRLVARVDAHVLLKFKFSYQVSPSSVEPKAKKNIGDICAFVAPKRHDTRLAGREGELRLTSANPGYVTSQITGAKTHLCREVQKLDIGNRGFHLITAMPNRT